MALALQRNRDAIAARLEIEASELDVVAARLYPNPRSQYDLGNLVLGTANLSSWAAGAQGSSDQPVQSVGVSGLLDVWAKRSARMKAAERGVEHRRWLVEDALREIAYAVRSAFADVLREQTERQLARDFADRYGQTVSCRRPGSRRATSPRPSCARSSSRASATRTTSSTPRCSSTWRAGGWRRCWRSPRRASCRPRGSPSRSASRWAIWGRSSRGR